MCKLPFAPSTIPRYSGQDSLDSAAPSDLCEVLPHCSFHLFFSNNGSLQMVAAAMKLKDACSLEKKIMTNLDSILKSRDVTLPTKVHLVKAVVFPVVMYGCESWTMRKAERRRIDAFGEDS